MTQTLPIDQDTPAGTHVRVRRGPRVPLLRTITLSPPRRLASGEHLIGGWWVEVAGEDGVSESFDIGQVYYDNPSVSAGDAIRRSRISSAEMLHETTGLVLRGLLVRLKEAAGTYTGETFEEVRSRCFPDLDGLLREYAGEPSATTGARSLKDDVRRGLKIAWEITPETQTVEEACTDLVRLVRMARDQRDEAFAKAQRAPAEARHHMEIRLAAAALAGARQVLLGVIHHLRQGYAGNAGEQALLPDDAEVLVAYLETWRRKVDSGEWKPSGSPAVVGTAAGPAPAPVEPEASPLHPIEACRDLQSRIEALELHAVGLLKSPMGPAIARGVAHAIHYLGRANEIFQGR